MEDDGVKKALEKCAMGFETGEVVEEFAVEDGEIRLVKRKVTRRDIPPDIKAVKMLLEDGDAARLSDEQLESEKERILALIKEENFD